MGTFKILAGNRKGFNEGRQTIKKNSHKKESAFTLRCIDSLFDLKGCIFLILIE